MDLTKLLIAGLAVAGGVYAYKKYTEPKKHDPEDFKDPDKAMAMAEAQLKEAYHSGSTDEQRILILFSEGAKFAAANAEGICAAMGPQMEVEDTPVEGWLEFLAEQALAAGYSREALEAVVATHAKEILDANAGYVCP